MEPKDRAEAYIALSAQLNEQYHQRRSLEWQMHLALWTLLAAAAYALTTQAPSINHVLLVGALVIVVVVHFVFAVKIHTGQVKEQGLSFFYRKRAELLLHEDSVPSTTNDSITALPTSREEGSAMPDRLQRFFKSYWWWLGAEMITTMLIASAVYVLAVSAVPRATAESVSSLERDLNQARTELVQVRQRLDATEARLDRLQQVQLTAPTLPGRAATPR